MTNLRSGRTTRARGQDSFSRSRDTDALLLFPRRKARYGENDAIRAGYVPQAVHHGWPVGGALAGRQNANLFRTTRARGERHVTRPAYGLAVDAESQTVARGSLYGWWPGRTRRLDPRRPRSSSRQSPNQTQRALGRLAPAYSRSDLAPDQSVQRERTGSPERRTPL